MPATIDYTVEQEQMTVSRVIWASLRRQPSGLADRVLELNPGIENQIFIPVGTVVKIPIEEINNEPEEDVIRLWD